MCFLNSDKYDAGEIGLKTIVSFYVSFRPTTLTCSVGLRTIQRMPGPVCVHNFTFLYLLWPSNFQLDTLVNYPQIELP